MRKRETERGRGGHAIRRKTDKEIQTSRSLTNLFTVTHQNEKGFAAPLKLNVN